LKLGAKPFVAFGQTAEKLTRLAIHKHSDIEMAALPKSTELPAVEAAPDMAFALPGSFPRWAKQAAFPWRFWPVSSVR
jgi:hypothetical protein